MHDPMTVAHEIKIFGCRLATIWHVDPERDGSDDSCGWFMRARHGDQKTLDKIVSDFRFQWSHGVPFGWFDAEGNPNHSVHSIVMGMFRIAANHVFGHWSKRANRFLEQHTFEILHFAENTSDSLWTGITRYYQRKHAEPEQREERIREMAGCVYAWILRESRPWWRHPRWHIHHWHIQIHPLELLRRRWLTRCEVCGSRFKRGEPVIGMFWDPPPRRWFELLRSERGCRHEACMPRATRTFSCD